MNANAIIDHLDAAGLRGRGGAGFPTARKWRTVRDYCSTFERASVVVNAAEGEPGTLKDRTIMRNNPYQVIEGALIACARGRRRPGNRRDEGGVRDRGRAAGTCDRRDRRRRLGADGVEIEIFQGPEEYLYGEETALLEAIDGRYPFPRTSPPYRRGVRRGRRWPTPTSAPTVAPRRTSRWPHVITSRPRRPHSSRTWKRSPTWAGSSPAVRSGSAPSAPNSRPAHSCAPSPGRPAAPRSARSRWVRRCAR